MDQFTFLLTRSCPSPSNNISRAIPRSRQHLTIKNRPSNFVNISQPTSHAIRHICRVYRNVQSASTMEIKLLSCPLCLKPHFEGVDALRSTLVSVATSHLSCPVCSETLLGLDKLTIHLFSHINSAPTANGAAHQDDVHEEIDKSIERCRNSEDTDQKVTTTSKMEQEEEVLKCDICSFSFTDRNILEMHQKLLHQTTPDKKTGNYSYHCHLCSKKFRMRGSLMVHLRVAHYGFGHHHHQVDGEERSKKQCGEERVKEEKEAAGEGKCSKWKVQDNKQWECDVCSKMFTTKYFLKKHKRLHTGKCSYASCSDVVWKKRRYIINLKP